MKNFETFRDYPKRSQKMSREAYRKALFLEMTRQAVLEDFPRKKPCRSEDEAAVFAMWILLNPFGIEGRESVEIPYYAPEEKKLPFFPKKLRRVRTLIAHSHPDEPLNPSPDDLLLFVKLDLERGACSFYIADGFEIRKIR